MMCCMNLSDLPEGCLSHILSLTSPSDVLRSSAVSKQFLSASLSDNVWEKFLPSDCDHIISQSSTPLDHHNFATKKDFFFHLCHSPILFSNNTQSFGLDKWSGKRCYMLGARTLKIAWIDNSQYWTWQTQLESRFPEVAELQSVCWLDIKGTIHTKLLSSNTTYGAYFVFKKIDNYSNGFLYTPVKTYVLEIDEQGSLPGDDNDNHGVIVNRFYLEASEDTSLLRRLEELPVERDDGWMEIEMGRCDVKATTDQTVVLEMKLEEIEHLNWKQGIVVQGIELRPLN